MALKASDRRRASASNNLLGNYRIAGNEQTMLVRDIISEGPIEGLVAGGTSIYLNDDTLMTQAESPISSAGGQLKVTGSVGSKVLTVSNPGNIVNANKLDADFIVIRNILTVKGNITLVKATDISFPGSDTIRMSYTYKFTITSGGTFTTSLGSSLTGGSVPASGVTDLIGSAVLPDGSGTPLLNITSTSFEFISTKSTLDELTMPVIVTVSQFYKIIGTTTDTITLASPLQYAVSNRDISVPGRKPVIKGKGSANSTGGDKKYINSSFQFSPGILDQAPHSSFFGSGTSSFELSGPDIGSNLTDDAPQTIQGLGGSVTASQIAAIDKAVITFQYPNGLYRVNKDQGNEYPEFVAYRIELAVQRTTDVNELNTFVKLPGTYTYTASEPPAQSYKAVPITIGEKLTLHLAKTKDAYLVTEVVDLEPYKPFVDFRIRVTRVTGSGESNNSETMYSTPNWKDHPNSTSIHTAKISNVTGLLTEKFNYPYTALATVTFSSKNFSSMPTRGYECFGMKVQVPDIYITREENDGLNAKYTRDPSNGGDSGIIQFWSGAFREEKVYTDNPAWIFYDIVTNNRYGIGDWMQKEGDSFVDIDIYSLFKIAKYCDELVPDGKGGLEPRMRGNFYFTKATDCYKVLKDIATSFRSILYWADGKLMPVMDAPREPVYTFTKGNVIGGEFSYESTGSKTRANQIVVSWVNPANNYKMEPLIVEDRDNIIDTGRILQEDATAFGATSYGQALRYGRWKLWTAINQTEIISFSTSINAAFLAPGDVINVQDAHEHSIAFSGRILGVASATRVTLDRQIPITVNANNSYQIAVLYTGTFGILNQASATVNGVVYSKGDVIPSITTKEAAENVVDSTTGTYVDILLSNTSYVVTRDVVSSSVDSNGKTVLVCDPFDTNPAVNTIWAIKHLQGGREVATSYKQYKIMSISQDEKSKYSIAAVEYFDEKFQTIETDFTLEQDDPIFPDESTYDDVPNVQDLRVSVVPKLTEAGENVVVYWNAPLSIYPTTNSVTYEHLRGYEIEYLDQDERYIEEIGPDKTSHSLNLNSIDSSLFVGITVISTNGRRSEQVTAAFNLSENKLGTATRFKGLRVGALSDTHMSLNTETGLISFIKQPTLAPSSIESQAKTILTEVSQASSDIAIGSSAYVFVDYSKMSSGDAIKLINYLDNTTLKVPYWYDIQDANTFTTRTGTVTITANSSKVTGNNTQFTEVFSEEKQNVIRFTSTKAALVSYVESDTVLYIDRVFSTNTVSTYSSPSLDLDYSQDFLIAKIDRVEADKYAKTSYLTIDTDLEAAGIYSIKTIYADDEQGSNPSFDPEGKSFVYFYRYLGEEPSLVFESQEELDLSFPQPGEEDVIILLSDISGVVFARVQGESALSVVISSSNEGFIFKNNEGASKLLTAKVYDNATGLEITSAETTISYNWTIDGTQAYVDADNNLDQNAGIPATQSTIWVGPEDIVDNGSNLISCEVTVD